MLFWFMVRHGCCLGCCYGFGKEGFLQTTIENINKRRYHKMFDLILTLTCDNATLCTRLALLERESKILSFFDLKLLCLQSDTIDTGMC